MVAYKLNMMHDEWDTQNLSPVGHNRNTYTRKEKTVVMIPLCFFRFTGTCMTLLLLIIQTSAAIKFLKLYIQSYPISALLVQNTRSNEAKQKLPQILP